MHNKLKELRQFRGVTQVQMAKDVGIARQTYLDIENGKTDVRLKVLEKMAKRLNIGANYFLDIPVKYQLSAFTDKDLLLEVARRMQRRNVEKVRDKTRSKAVGK